MYRSNTLNESIEGASKTSQHLLGEAIDIQGISPVTNKDIFKYAIEELNYHQIIWEYGTKNEPSWVHIGYREGSTQKKNTRAYKNTKNKTVYINFDLKID